MSGSVAAPRVNASHRLGLVLTGGTVGSEVDITTRGPVVGLADRSNGETPEIALVESALEAVGGAEIRVAQPIGLLSENLLPEDWIRIAQAASALIERDGVGAVLILHGTDTMSYTAAALSFLLAHARVPIVLTGANLPPNQPQSDAAKNLNDALVALDSLDAGTYIAFAGGTQSPGWVHVGTRARKVRASGPAFVSVNRQPAGKVVDGSYQPIHPLHTEPRRPAPFAVDERVLALRLYPGLDFHAIGGLIDAGLFRGVVLELYASATAPAVRGRNSATEFVRRCRERGVPVISAVPAAPSGAQNVYEATIELEEAGAVFVHDMLPETALVKLMWALGQHDSLDEIASTMLTPVGEDLKPR